VGFRKKPVQAVLGAQELSTKKNPTL